MQLTRFPANYDEVSLQNRFEAFEPRSRFILQILGNTAALALWMADRDASDTSTTAWSKIVDIPADGGTGNVATEDGSPAFKYMIGGVTGAARLTTDPGDDTVAFLGETGTLGSGYVTSGR